jgi:hypothetical protein
MLKRKKVARADWAACATILAKYLESKCLTGFQKQISMFFATKVFYLHNTQV